MKTAFLWTLCLAMLSLCASSSVLRGAEDEAVSAQTLETGRGETGSSAAQRDANLLMGRSPDRPAFSLKGCFRNVHGPDVKTVTLGEEGTRTLDEAIAALRPDGGVILVPPGTYENQNFRLGRESMSVTLRGILGPGGRRPRFLFKGPKPSGTFMSFGVTPWANYKERVAAPPNRDQALIENLEIGGYGAALSIGNCARFVMKNCIVHDSPNNLIGSANLSGEQRCSLEFFGNEIYHGGQGNHKHNLYLHRGLDGAFVRVAFINNHCHSARGSSALKSIANEHVIVGNLFESASPDEPDKERYCSTLLVDVPAASDNLIANNTFRYRGESVPTATCPPRQRPTAPSSSTRSSSVTRSSMSATKPSGHRPWSRGERCPKRPWSASAQSCRFAGRRGGSNARDCGWRTTGTGACRSTIATWRDQPQASPPGSNTKRSGGGCLLATRPTPLNLIWLGASPHHRR